MQNVCQNNNGGQWSDLHWSELQPLVLENNSIPVEIWLQWVSKEEEDNVFKWTEYRVRKGTLNVGDMMGKADKLPGMMQRWHVQETR